MTAAALNIISRFQSTDPILLRERLADFAANPGSRRRVRERESLNDQRGAFRHLKQVA